MPSLEARVSELGPWFHNLRLGQDAQIQTAPHHPLADLPANFLIAIREDAYAGLGDLFKGRTANVYGNYLHIEYLDRASAEKAIRAPLSVYNELPGVVERVEIQDELVEAVLDQVRAYDTIQDGAATMNGGGRVATPLLQLVMETVWERERAEGSHAILKVA